MQWEAQICPSYLTVFYDYMPKFLMKGLLIGPLQVDRSTDSLWVSGRCPYAHRGSGGRRRAHRCRLGSVLVGWERFNWHEEPLQSFSIRRPWANETIWKTMKNLLEIWKSWTFSRVSRSPPAAWAQWLRPHNPHHLWSTSICPNAPQPQTPNSDFANKTMFTLTCF